MMLEYFDWKEAAALIEKALEQSFLDARATHDLARFMPNGTSLSTSASLVRSWKELKNKSNE